MTPWAPASSQAGELTYAFLPKPIDEQETPMSRKIVTLAAMLAAAALVPQSSQAADAPKPAAADLMSSLYGNTIILEIAPFWAAKQYYEPDHTWRQVDSEGVVVSGIWKVQNGETCTVQTSPPGPTYCHPYVARKVGDRWTNVEASLGVETVITLEAGRK